MTKDLIQQRFADCAATIARTHDELADKIEQAANLIAGAYRNKAGVFLFGNGGSAADAQHVAGELVGRFLKERPPLKAQAFSTDTSILTCVSNDYGYDQVFARQVEANTQPGDIVVGFSTSGNSANVVKAFEKAREMNVTTIALTGQGGGQCADCADLLLAVPSNHTPHIQEAHILICHVICELVDNQL